MSTVDLARLQFAMTASTHFLFVLLTLGLVLLVAIMQTRFVLTGKPVYERMTRFWGQLYVINYAVGIATGLVMEFQFGLNWSGLAHLTGDVFGVPLAIETLVAFVLESTLLGMWIFGWGRLGRRVHLLLIWGVVLTAYLSAFWIMVANAFLQHPVGYEVDTDGRARAVDLGALVGNPNVSVALGHVVGAAVLTAGVVVTAVTAWHALRRHPDIEFVARSMRTGVIAGFVGAFIVTGFGYAQLPVIADTQPTKLGDEADRQRVVAEMVATHGPGDYLPPAAVVGIALAVMLGIGNLFFLAALAQLPMLYRDALVRSRWLRPVLVLQILVLPLPFLVAILGWVVREIGRQPWAVYDVLKTADAVSDVDRGTMLTSLVGFTVLLLGLLVLDWWLLARHALRGPGREFLPDPGPPESTVDTPVFSVEREPVGDTT